MSIKSVFYKDKTNMVSPRVSLTNSTWLSCKTKIYNVYSGVSCPMILSLIRNNEIQRNGLTDCLIIKGRRPNFLLKEFHNS